MPRLDFQCSGCDAIFELWVLEDEQAQCPYCSSTHLQILLSNLKSVMVVEKARKTNGEKEVDAVYSGHIEYLKHSLKDITQKDRMEDL